MDANLHDYYSHKQYAPLCILIYALAAIPMATAYWGENSTTTTICVGVFLLTLYIASSFHYLAIEDRGDCLRIAFGPMPLFGRWVRYQDIERVEISRTLLADGWGIHLSLRGGWVWNIWGRDCVGVHFHNGGKLWIGTDDATNLACFLEQRSRL